MKKIISFSISFFFVVTNAQQLPGKLIMIPDIPGYKTLKCDFHMHTVFSDGEVWPTIRVVEAWQEGLDAIAITDHIEYQPHKSDVNQDLNRSYNLAEVAAAKTGIILIKALEITRPMPPGHLNALFVGEPDSLKKKDYLSVLKEAKDQGAFVFWNHPGWKSQAPDGIKWYDVHTDVLNKGLFQGIEVVNGNEFYPEALAWCLEKNLTIIGNSDMHTPIGIYLQEQEISHRPFTLVFAKERSPGAIKEALINHRTAVWSENKLIGSVVFLEPMFKNIILLNIVSRDEKSLYVKLTNPSDIEIWLNINTGDRTYKLKPRTSEIIILKPDTKKLEVMVPNFLIGKDKYLTTNLVITK